MKNTYLSILRNASMLLFGVLMFPSCSKDEDKQTIETPLGQLSLSISSPAAPELSLFLNNQRSTTKPLTYGATIPYMPLAAGKYDLRFSKKDSTSVFAKTNGEIKPGKAYTLMVVGKAPKATLIFVEDDLTAPATNKAKIRFANLSPDSASLDLYIAGKAEAAISKRPSTSVTNFISVDPGAELKLEIKENGKTEVLATLEKVKIEKGKIYTISAKGVKGAIDATKLGLDIVTNK